MSDSIPTAVKDQLRREVGFGCPIRNCRSPFLTFHHFDPPRRIRQHNNPDGMIALCWHHHQEAEGGNLSKGELRALKRSSYAHEDVKASFPWFKRHFLVRLGGCYAGSSRGDVVTVLAVDGKPAVQLQRGDEGLLALSLELPIPKTRSVLRIENNVLRCAPNVLHRLRADARATSVTVWFADKRTGLDLKFARITPEQLQRRLDDDRARAWPADLPLPVDDGSIMTNPAGYSARKWAEANAMDDEHLISILDINNLRLETHYGLLEIKEGVSEQLQFCSAFDSRVAFNVGAGHGAFALGAHFSAPS